MKQKITAFLLILLCGAVAFLSAGCDAADTTRDPISDTKEESLPPRQSVYCDTAERDAVYEALQKGWYLTPTLESLDVTILKESITPVYYADILDYAKTGELQIEPYIESVHGGKGIRSNGNVYIAKGVTSDGRFGGNIEFSIEDGMVSWGTLWPSPASNFLDNGIFGASCSYADHAGRIQALLQKDSFVPVENVKFVMISGFGRAFYINDGDTDYLVSMGSFFAEPDDRLIEEQVKVYPVGGEELKKVADEKVEQRNHFLAEQEALKKEHPDTWMEYVGLVDQSTHFIADWIYETDFDNILNISKYLNQSP